jgi:hypothetical protein
LVPEPKEEMKKYSGSRENKMLNLFNVNSLLTPADNDFICNGAKELVSAALAKSTWSKNMSGLNNLTKFEVDSKILVKWPINIETIRSFAVWCVEKKKLKSETVKSYISAIKLAHTLQGLECVNFSKDKILCMILDGAKNLQRTDVCTNSKRKVVTLQTLLVLGHRIAISSWSSSSKIVFWSLCTVAFFTSARMGELLCKAENCFDKTSDLLWKDVLIGKDHAIIHLKNPKSKKPEGEFLDVFKFNSEKCCPYLSLTALRNFQIKNNFFDRNLPVFRFDSGKNLTQNVVNTTLKSLLSDIYVPGIM